MTHLTDGEFSALQILAMGAARRASFTKTDKAHGIHAVNSNVAKGLIAKGLAKPMQHWDGCVEITDAGRACLSPTLT